jgi:Na+-translocating ferredoxin:NAD+ oxidoreductase RnfG subunit
MLVVSAVFGLAVSFVHYSTQDMLAKNEAMHKNRILSHAFLLNVQGQKPGDYAKAVKEHLNQEVIKTDQREIITYRIQDEKSQKVGFVFSSMGFWDRITGIIVLTGDLEEIVNIKFFEQKETPGLGARIEEAWFTDQFKGLSIEWEKPVTQRVIFDAITGASQTSMALMKSLNTELEIFRKALE